MHITKLDHVNLRTTQLTEMIDWYSKLLGLKSGDRPNFPFNGAWLYAGENAVIHLVEVQGSAAIGSEVELKLEHFALSAVGLNEFLEKITQLDVPYRRSDRPEINLTSINIWDPDGNHIHVDFKSND